MRKVVYIFPLLIVLLMTACFSTKRVLSRQAEIIATEEYDDLRIYKRIFNEEAIHRLSATKTVFLYPDAMIGRIDSFKKAIAGAWDITPVTFDSYINGGKYITDTTWSIFKIEAAVRRYTQTESGTDLQGHYRSKTTEIQTCHYYLTLHTSRMAIVRGKERLIASGLCRIELFPDFPTTDRGGRLTINDSIISTAHRIGVFYNLTPTLIATQIKIVAQNLKNNVRPYFFTEVKNDQLGSLLANDTLYIPRSIMMHMRPLGGKEWPITENLFKKYAHPFKICNDQELFSIFEKEKRGRFLFEYVKSFTDKFVSIYDAKEGRIVYKKYIPGSYNLKVSDIAMISRK